MPSKQYSQLIFTDDSELTEDELHRKRFCEALPYSVLSALTVRADRIRAEVIRLEKERDEIIDFINGYNWEDFLPPDDRNTTKDGDTE